jgi:hypothetical protein
MSQLTLAAQLLGGHPVACINCAMGILTRLKVQASLLVAIQIKTQQFSYIKLDHEKFLGCPILTQTQFQRTMQQFVTDECP